MGQRTGYRPKKKKNDEEPLLTILCFQIGLCLLSAAVFFAAVQMGGEGKELACQSAQLLCGQTSQPLSWQQTLEETWQKISSFWQGGAEQLLKDLLEQLRDLIADQIVPPEQLPEVTVGESGEQVLDGAGGVLPDDLLSAAEGTTLAPYLLTASMWSPVSGPVTSQFGWRLHPVSGGEDFHKGVDIAAAEGTSILAALPGVVEETGYNDSYGNFVVLRHSDNLRTTYNHCSEILVQEGQQMARGDRIALVGSTGISTGPHLHFEVEVQGLKADPLPSLQVEEVSVQ